MATSSTTGAQARGVFPSGGVIANSTGAVTGGATARDRVRRAPNPRDGDYTTQ